MTLRIRWQRTVHGAALAAALVGPGCKELPVRRVDPSLDPRTVNTPTPPGYEPPALPPLPPQVAARSAPISPPPLQAISDREALTGAAATPLLDAALVRAAAIEEAVAGAAEPEGPTVPARPPVKDVAAAPAPTAEMSGPPESPPSAAVTPAPAEPATAPETLPLVPDPAPDPNTAWRERLEELRALARAQSAVPGATTRVWALRESVLSSLNEVPQSPDSDESKGTLWEVVLSALANGNNASSNPAGTSGTSLRAAASALDAEAPLEIADLRLCHRVLGFGNYVPIETDDVPPGASLIVYCEMAGLRYEADGDVYRSRLEARVEVVPEGSEDPVWSRSLGKAEDVCRHPRRDYYVNYRVALPDSLSKGAYRLRLVQNDALANRQAERSLMFRID